MEGPIISSPIQNCSGMENNRGEISASLGKYQERKKRKLLRREYTENPESKLEVARQNGDMIPQSSIQDNANTDLGTTATVQLSKRQIRRNRKLLRDAVENPEITLEVARQNGDLITQSSIQDNANTYLGTSATAELSKHQIRRNRKLLRDAAENPESKLEVAHGNVDIITQSSIRDSPHTDLGATATVQLSKRQIRRNRKLLRDAAENPESKLEVARRPFRITTLSSIQDNANTDLGTTATVELSKRKERRNRKLLKREETENRESKLEVALQNVDMITQSSIQDTANTDLGTTATVELSKLQKRRNRKLLERGDTENPDSKLEVAPQNVDMITQSSIQDNANTDLGTTATVELSKCKERRNRKLLKREETENRESKLEVALQNVDMITQSSIQDTANTDLGTTATVELSKRQKRRNRKLLERGDTENPESKLEVARQNVDMITQSSIQDNPNIDLGTTATVELSNRRERRNRKLLKREDTENRESKLEVAPENVDMITESSIQDNANTDLGEMGSNICENVHVEGTIEKKKKKKSKRNKSTLGETLSPQQLEDMEVAIGERDSGTTATDNTVAKKRERQKLENKNPASGDILGTDGCIQDMVLAKKGRSTKVLEPDSKRSAEKKRQKLNNFKGELLTTDENTQDSIIAKKDTDTNKVLEAKTVSKVEECTSISRKTEKLIKKKGDAGLKANDVIPHFPTSGKKLVVFDVNGLLVDIVSPRPKDAKADLYIPKRAIFKRPFLDDFLIFCFERFHVGIWSSRTKKVLDPVVNYVLGDLKNKLLFIWDATSCTSSGMKTLEDRHKPMVFKDLRKIWEKNGPGNSWVKGTYNESNTLLFDDSPYKALLNPKHSGIFPVSYSYKNKNDNFLGPIGALRTYLEGVAATDNLKMYVEQNPFGQDFIDEKNRNWSFYSRVLLKSRNY